MKFFKILTNFKVLNQSLFIFTHIFFVRLFSSLFHSNESPRHDAIRKNHDSRVDGTKKKVKIYNGKKFSLIHRKEAKIFASKMKTFYYSSTVGGFSVGMTEKQESTSVT